MNSTALRPRGGPSRGGIQKRPGAGRVRVDRDGDLDMDAPTGGARGGGARGGRGRGNFNRGGGGPGSNPPRGPASDRQRGQGGSGAMRGNPRRDPVGTRQNIRAPQQGGRPRPGEPHINEGPLVEARVYGWKESKGSAEECVSFLERKSRLKFKKTSKQGDCIIIQLPLSKLSSLTEWDNAAFASSHVRITTPSLNNITNSVETRSNVIISQAAQSGDTMNTIKTLEQVLAMRYNIGDKFLDLSKLGEDPLLRQNGFFELGSTASKMFPALMQVADKKFASAQQKRDTVHSVSLGYNQLKDVRAVTSLSLTFPDIKNLSLQGNEIATWAGLDSWRNRFKNLEQLILMGNPICRLPGMKEEAMRRWPMLQMLDNVTLDRTIIRIGDESRRGQAPTVEGMSGAVDERGRPVLPAPIRKSFIEDPSGAGMEFLSTFFNLYDSDKPRVLAQFYEPTTTFSLSVNTSAVRVESQQQARQYWDSYIPRSRNLTRITHAGSIANRLFIGPRAIGDVWGELPTVRHNLANEELWSFDVWPHDDGVIACVHGEFEECNDDKGLIVKRSFDRTFVLRPGADGSVKVNSDLLLLRAYGGYEAWKELQPPPIVAAAGMQVDMGQQQQQQLEELQKMNMCTEFARRSGLTMEFTQLCLTTSEWDLERGWAAFVNAKANGQLPAHAFDLNPAVPL